jgi:hypothetical protein
MSQTLVRRLCRRWDRFVDDAGRPRSLIGASVFRVIAALAILYQYLSCYHQRHYLFGPRGAWPFASPVEQATGEGGLSLYLLSPSPVVFELIFHAGIVVTALFLLGWHTRAMTLLTLVLFWSLHQRNPMVGDGGDNLVTIILIYGVFAKLGAHFSLDASRAQPARGATWQRLEGMLHNAAMLASAVQLCLMYGLAGLYKVQGQMWQSGTAIYYVLRNAEYGWPGIAERVYQDAWLVNALTYATVAFQVSFPFFLFLNRHTRRLALLGGIMFHVGIATFMGLVTFAAFMVSVDLMFVTDGEYRALFALMARARAAIPRLAAPASPFVTAGPAPGAHDDAQEIVHAARTPERDAPLGRGERNEGP